MRNSPQKAVLQEQAEYADFLVCIGLPGESHIDRSHSELTAMQLVCLSRTGRSYRENSGNNCTLLASLKKKEKKLRW